MTKHLKWKFGQNKKQDLTTILQRDENGKPILNLIPLERTAVNFKTKEESDTYLRIVECGGWKWRDGNLPTKPRFYNWNEYKEETCIDAGVDYNKGGKYNNGEFGFAYKEFYKNWKVIPTQDFYKAQNPPITPEMSNEINNWFEENSK